MHGAVEIDYLLAAAAAALRPPPAPESS
jgi:hypothetical protein